MIWGLDSNGAQLAQTRNHLLSAQSYKPLPHSIPSSRITSETVLASRPNQITQTLYNQDVIDLSRPEFHVPLFSRASGVQQYRPLSTYPISADDGQLSRKDARSRKSNLYEFVREDSPIQLYPSSFGPLHIEANAWNAGLGIDIWRGSREADGFLPSDSALIPHDNRESLLVLDRPLETIQPTQIYQTPRNLAAQEMRTLEHHSHWQRLGMPTPPDTGSPQWSPRFRQSYPPTASPEFHCNQIPSTHYSHFQRPLSISTRDSFISSHQIQERLSAIPNYPSPATESCITGDFHQMPPPYRSPDSVVADRSSSDTRDDDPEPKPRHSQSRPNANNGLTPSPVSPEMRRNLSQQQTRSIPLARLIQRRLSSVIEEEVNVESGAHNDHNFPPGSSPPRLKQGPECSISKTSRLSKGEKGEPQPQGRRSATGLSPPAGPSNDHAKRAYRPPGHPSRRVTSGTRDALVQSQKSSRQDQLNASTNRFGEDKENAVVVQKTSGKSKKTSKKKKYGKKQEVVSTTDKQT